MLPLVLAFHAYGESISNFETLTGFDALANTEDFIVAYPEGLPDPKITTKTLPHWDTEPGSMDVKFIRDLVTAIEGGGYNVDPTRIYATGFSNGGGMVNRVGCDLSGIVAAIAPVEGGYGEPDWAICNPVFPVAVMAIHGIPDSTVPYYGGVSKKDGAAGIDFPDIPDWAAAWALRDSCNRVPIVSTYNSDIITTEYPNCHWSYSVILYSIDNNDHYWPGSSTLGASQAINATAEIWNFFSKWQSLA
jgi:polyhydroxybutyrate depolymerase